VWTLAKEVGRLVRVDPRTGRAAEFPPAVDLGGGSYGGLAAGAETIWVAHDSEDGGVDAVDPRTGAGTRHTPLPNAKAVAFGRASVWALSAARGRQPSCGLIRATDIWSVGVWRRVRIRWRWSSATDPSGSSTAARGR
jgi:hypothetical protein